MLHSLCMIIISLLIALASLSCPFLIFLDYHKRKNVHVSIIYVSLFFVVIFLTYKFIYYYGMIVAGLAPLSILILFIIKKKH